jgi:4-oxalocrotonate tautomerase
VYDLGHSTKFWPEWFAERIEENPLTQYRNYKFDRPLTESILPKQSSSVTDEGVTKEQKQQLIQGATQLLAEVPGKIPATTVVVIDEMNTDCWALQKWQAHSH